MIDDMLPDLLQQLHELPDVRPDKVDSLRRAIARGGYDDEGKLNLAVDRMFEEP